MTLLIGVVGATALFSIFAFTATRKGARLEGPGSCQGEVCSLDPSSLGGECQGCGQAETGSGWWPRDGVTDGDRR